MYKARLQPWGFTKNSTADDFLALANLLEERKRSGKHSTEFLVHGRRKTVGDLKKHIKSKQMSEEDYLLAARDHDIPTHIRAYTPDPGGTKRPPSQQSANDLSTPSPTEDSKRVQYTPSTSGSPQSPCQNPVEDVVYGPAFDQHSVPPAAMTSGIGQHSMAARSNLAPDEDFLLVPAQPSPLSTPPSPVPCDKFEQIVGAMTLQVVEPKSLRSLYGVDDLDQYIWVSSPARAGGPRSSDSLCSTCKQPGSLHAIYTGNLPPPNQAPRNMLNESSEEFMAIPSSTRDRGGVWRWVHLCFMACICKFRDDHEFWSKSLADAASEFEKVLLRRDPLILVALNLTVAILHMHDQGDIAGAILQSSLNVAERVLDSRNPIRTCVRWATAASTLGLKKSDLTSEVMRGVFKTFNDQLGATHQYTIAALYILAWMLLFEGSYSDDKGRANGLYKEAEEKMERLYEVSSSVLGSKHMQSLMALTSLSRAQLNQGKRNAAIKTMQTAITDSEDVLGRCHPFTLESKRRLANMLGDNGRKDLMVHLYWEVLRGRIKMLGPLHTFTKGARNDLEALLKNLGQWHEDGSTELSIDQLFEAETPSTPPLEAF
jgi:hypothetical protein